MDLEAYRVCVFVCVCVFVLLSPLSTAWSPLLGYRAHTLRERERERERERDREGRNTIRERQIDIDAGRFKTADQYKHQTEAKGKANSYSSNQLSLKKNERGNEEPMDRQTDGWMDRRKDGQKERRTGGQMDGQIDGPFDRRTDIGRKVEREEGREGGSRWKVDSHGSDLENVSLSRRFLKEKGKGSLSTLINFITSLKYIRHQFLH